MIRWYAPHKFHLAWAGNGRIPTFYWKALLSLGIHTQPSESKHYNPLQLFPWPVHWRHTVEIPACLQRVTVTPHQANPLSSSTKLAAQQNAWSFPCTTALEEQEPFNGHKTSSCRKRCFDEQSLWEAHTLTERCWPSLLISKWTSRRCSVSHLAHWQIQIKVVLWLCM